MAKAQQDIPGNAIASAQAIQRHLVGTGERVALFEKYADNLFDDGTEIVGLSLRCPTENNPAYLWVVKAVSHDARVVAFHGGDTFEESLRGVLARLGNKSLKWREDNYA